MSRLALEKAGLEGARVVALAVIPVLITALQSGSFDLTLILVTGAIALLRFIDKYLHEVGKETDNKVLVKGLTQF